jgi:peptidoglycan biosynthesis protein MviN/MurJ (putative lipid II flippase)
LGESGLALATAVSSLAQLLLLAVGFSHAHAPLDWRRLAGGAFQALLATATLAVAVLLVGQMATAAGIESIAGRLALATGAGGLAFVATLWALGSDELAIVWPARAGSTRARSAESQTAANRSAQVTNLAP